MYWEREDRRTISNQPNKYQTIFTKNDTFTFQSQLIFFNLNEADIDHQYTCISKNIMGIAKIQFTLTSTGINVAYYDNSVLMEGTIPTNVTSYEDLCPIPPACKECATTKYDYSLLIYFKNLFQSLLTGI